MKNIFLSTVAIIWLIGCGSGGSEVTNNLVEDQPVGSKKQNQKVDEKYGNLYDLKDAIQKAENKENRVGDTTNLYFDGDLIEVLLLNEEYKHSQLFQKDEHGNIVNEEYFYEGEVDTAKVGEYELFYFIKDKNGFKNGFKKHIFVVKNTPPKIELLGDATIELNIGEIFTIPFVKVFDREDGKGILDFLKVSGSVDIYKAGSYNIKYSVIDRGGLKAEISRVVKVVGKDDMKIAETNDHSKDSFELLNYLKTTDDHEVDIYNQREFIAKSNRESDAFGSKIGGDKIVLSKRESVFDLSLLESGTSDTKNNVKISLNAKIGDKLTDNCILDSHYSSIEINDKHYEDIIKIVCKNRSEGYYQKDFGLIAENILLPRSGKELTIDNNDYIGRDLMNIDALYSAKYNLSGRGIKVGIVDGGFVLDTHQELKNRVTIMKKDNEDVSYESHPTHVAGIIGASGINSQAIGVATSAQLYSLSFEQYKSSDENSLVDMDKNGIFLSNHSYGPETQLIYDTLSQNTDNFIASHKNNIAIVSSGNSRDGFGNYWTIQDFSSAKNVITIGALDKDKKITSFSSTGPVNSGRLKPDLVSFGAHVTSSDKGNDKDYVYMSGTSMSAPHITGLVALLEEEYQKINGEFLREDTAKAILISSATDLGRVGPDYEYGYGIPDALKAVKIIDSMARYDSLVIMDEVKEHNQREYSLFVPEDKEIKLTLSWIDPSKEAKYIEDEIMPNINSNLDIKIVDKDDKVYYPWSLDDDNPTTKALQTKPNSVDNVEQIVANLKKGSYRVIVSNKNMNIGNNQSFSLISNTPLGGTTLTKEEMAKTEFEYFMMNML